MLATQWLDTLDKHSGSAIAFVTAVLVIVTIFYVVITARLLNEAETERVDRRRREESEQARLVGGHIDFVWSDGDEATMLRLTVHNASPLPIRDLRGSVYRGTHLLDSYDPIPVVRPGTDVAWMSVPQDVGEGFRLQMDFDDDNGYRWRKYESIDLPLRRLT
jgi:hypothetical protein